jgi:hypothetical protein
MFGMLNLFLLVVALTGFKIVAFSTPTTFSVNFYQLTTVWSQERCHLFFTIQFKKKIVWKKI